jgi:hypothetical protein
MEAELAALRAVPAIPEGWVMLPRQATPKMAEAWDNGSPSSFLTFWQMAYSAMIAAAPKPAQPVKPLFEDLISQHPGLREELS